MLKNLARLFWKHRFSFLLLTGLLAVFLVNSLHTQYPDEFDNIAGGRLILTGALPYSGFFTHHAPFAYYLASAINLVSGVSFVRFRLIYGFLLFLFVIFQARYLKNRYGQRAGQTGYALAFLVGLMGTYTWAHMLLADSLAAYLLAFSYQIVLWGLWSKQAPSFKDLIFVSLLTFLGLLTSFTYLYLALVLYLFTFVWCTRHFGVNKLKTFWPKAVALALAPPLTYLAFLIITGSLSDFIYQAFTFNSRYYIYLPGGVETRNPIRIAIVFAYTFAGNFRSVMNQLPNLNFTHPFVFTLGFANACLWLYLGIKKRFGLLFFSIASVIFTAARANPLTTGETDYQAAVYQFLSLSNGLVAFFLLKDSLNRSKLDQTTRLIFSGMFLILTTFFFFFTWHLTEQASHKAYGKYMGQAPLIYDRPEVAPVLNQLVKPDETYWLGPFEFGEHYHMKRRLASKYWITIPAMDNSLKVQTELLSDIDKNKPPFVFFDHNFYIFGSRPGKFLEEYLDEKYINFEKLLDTRDFTINQQSVANFNTYIDIYLRKDRQDELMKRLEEVGIITLN